MNTQQVELTPEHPIAVLLETIELPECGRLVRNVGGWIWYEKGDYTLLDVSYAYIDNPRSPGAVTDALNKLLKPIKRMYEKAIEDTEFAMKYHAEKAVQS